VRGQRERGEEEREKGREAEPWIWWRRSSLGPPWPAPCSASLGGAVEREKGLRENDLGFRGSRRPGGFCSPEFGA